MKAKEPERNESEDAFVTELEKAYGKEFEYKSELDTKAVSMATMAGTVATLFMGFGTILLRDIGTDKLPILISASVILMAEIVVITFTIKFAIDAYKAKGRQYYSFFDPWKFFNKNEYREQMVRDYISMPKEEFNKEMIEEYLLGMKTNVDINITKKSNIVRSQLFFYIALLLIPMFAFVIVISKFVPQG